MTDLLFEVQEAPLQLVTPENYTIDVDKEKSLIRVDYGENGYATYRWLANVGANYRVVHNRDLFQYVESVINENMTEAQRAGMSTTDSMAYGGRDCYRVYTFPAICVIIGGNTVALRIIVSNSYGSKSLNFYQGAIDFFCSNGMITGEYVRTARKHTSKLELTGFGSWLRSGIRRFNDHAEQLEAVANKQFYRDSDISNILEHLVDINLITRADETMLHEAILKEHRRRSNSTHPSLWHLYSALTSVATHGELRATGNDHEATTRISRAKRAERIIAAAEVYYDKEISHAVR